jgi:hypothetical protein
MAFQIQAKDSVVAFGPFDTINAVQNLNLDPTFNEENFSELGNEEYTATSRTPETAGSFEVTSTGSVPSILARMIYDYDTQTYQYSPATQGNAYTIVQTDFENAIFDVINLKQPGETFSEATIVPNAQLTGLTFRADATGTGSETFSFEADLQEAFAAPYHDIVSVPLEVQSATTADIPADFTATIDSGTHTIVYVFKDNQKYWGDVSGQTEVATWSDADTISVTAAGFTTAAPFERVTAVLSQKVAGTFPTIYYPTAARFVKGDRADIWLMNSGTSVADANRLLRCQSADITVDLTRDRLQEIRRNDDLSTTYWRGLNFPLNITVNVSIIETELQQWADLQGKTIDGGAAASPIDSNNILNLVDFENESLRLEIRYYLQGDDNTLASVVCNKLGMTAFSERQQVQGRAERTIGLVGSLITITGYDL